MKRWSIFLVFLLVSQGVQALETKAKQAILMDDTTGAVLFEKNADQRMHPSSMSKLMTLYVAFSRLKDGSLKLDDQFQVSENAWRKQGSKSFLELGGSVTVEDLLRSIIIQSGNDACIVLAEGLAGSEENFAKEMNDMATKIGLKNSHFVNATGWPDERHLMTARDLALLSQRIIHDFPEYYHYFAELEFTYNNIRQHNRNLLLRSNIGVDGLKTGHTEIAGYGITVSAKHPGDGRRVILVINGLGSEQERAAEAEMLVRAGFQDFTPVTLLKAEQEVERIPVWFGTAKDVAAIAEKDITVILPRNERDKITFTLRYIGPLKAPVKKGARIAELVVRTPGGAPMAIPLAAAQDVEKLKPFARVVPALSYYLFGKR